MPNITFHAVPSWYWQPSAAWMPNTLYKEGDLVHRNGLEFDRYVCTADHISSPANAPRETDNLFWRIEYEERVPLNTEFVDNGVYLTTRDEHGVVTNLSTQVRRHGLVNTNKAGHYILTYYCKYLGVPWEGIKRKVIVYEPDWMSDTVPQIFLQYPVFRQTLQNYIDLYYELNYLADNVRLGLGVSKVTCDKFTRSWTKPEGIITGYKDGFWVIDGYTFKDGDKVTLSKELDDGTKISGVYYVQQVRTEKPWSVNGESDAEHPGLTGYYGTGAWVRFLDKNYVCGTGHTVTQDAKKIKPKVIYPVIKKTDKEGGVTVMQSDCWKVGCRVVLVKYLNKRDPETGDWLRKTAWAEDDMPVNALIGLTIRRFRPIIDSQGFIFEYSYDPQADIAPNSYNRHIDLSVYLHQVLANLSHDRLRYSQDTAALPSG